VRGGGRHHLLTLGFMSNISYCLLGRDSLVIVLDVVIYKFMDILAAPYDFNINK
jgi:hypothetical protein